MNKEEFDKIKQKWDSIGSLGQAKHMQIIDYMLSKDIKIKLVLNVDGMDITVNSLEMKKGEEINVYELMEKIEKLLGPDARSVAGRTIKVFASDL